MNKSNKRTNNNNYYPKTQQANARHSFDNSDPYTGGTAKPNTSRTNTKQKTYTTQANA